MSAAEAMEPVEAAVWGALAAASKRCRQPAARDVREVMDAVGALAADLKPKAAPVRFRHPDGSGTDLHELIGVLTGLLEGDRARTYRRQRDRNRERDRARFAPNDDSDDEGTAGAA